MAERVELHNSFKAGTKRLPHDKIKMATFSLRCQEQGLLNAPSQGLGLSAVLCWANHVKLPVSPF